MRRLSQADLLALWESGRTLHPLDQALFAVNAALPETGHEKVADWPLGHRNRALAQLRCACFGTTLRGWTSCRQCEERLEIELDCGALAETQMPQRDELVVVKGCAFRLPTSRDLARIAGEQDPREAAFRLLERCMVESPAKPEGQGSAASEWTEEDLDAIGEKMALADPLAEIMLHFDCPACGVSFDESLDLPAFLWTEIEGRAKRLLLEVHTLASAYGWSEAEILSLSAVRREFYLEMVRA
jgi:hypothetical protein